VGADDLDLVHGQAAVVAGARGWRGDGGSGERDGRGGDEWTAAAMHGEPPEFAAWRAQSIRRLRAACVVPVKELEFAGQQPDVFGYHLKTWERPRRASPLADL
jgi:hypothetical protein